MTPASRSPRPRGVFIAALLLLTLGLAVAIALQAYRTFLDHKATAEKVLRDNARVAAARFASRLSTELWYVAYMPPLDALWRAKAGTPGGPLPPPAQLTRGLEAPTAEFMKLVRYTFRYDLRTGKLETAGRAPGKAARHWLVDTLPIHSRTIYDPKEHLAAIVRTVDGVPRAIVYKIGRAHV